MATITVFNLLTVGTPEAPSGLYASRLARAYEAMTLSAVLAGTATLPGIGTTPRMVVMPSEGGTATVTRRLRGWHTVNAVNMTWLDGQATPSGVDPNTITVVGSVTT